MPRVRGVGTKERDWPCCSAGFVCSFVMTRGCILYLVFLRWALSSCFFDLFEILRRSKILWNRGDRFSLMSRSAVRPSVSKGTVWSASFMSVFDIKPLAERECGSHVELEESVSESE